MLQQAAVVFGGRISWVWVEEGGEWVDGRGLWGRKQCGRYESIDKGRKKGKGKGIWRGGGRERKERRKKNKGKV
jgi:hypothetical protein